MNQSSSSSSAFNQTPTQRTTATASSSSSSAIPPPPHPPRQHHHQQQQPFTRAMRDTQARGIDPSLPGTSTTTTGRRTHIGDETAPSSFNLGSGLPRDTYEERERKAFAMAVLDSPEKLMAYAHSENDSVAGQRLRFMQMLCGLDDAAAASGRRSYRQQQQR